MTNVRHLCFCADLLFFPSCCHSKPLLFHLISNLIPFLLFPMNVDCSLPQLNNWICKPIYIVITTWSWFPGCYLRHETARLGNNEQRRWVRMASRRNWENYHRVTTLGYRQSIILNYRFGFPLTLGKAGADLMKSLARISGRDRSFTHLLLGF